MGGVVCAVLRNFTAAAGCGSSAQRGLRQAWPESPPSSQPVLGCASLRGLGAAVCTAQRCCAAALRRHWGMFEIWRAPSCGGLRAYFACCRRACAGRRSLSPLCTPLHHTRAWCVGRICRTGAEIIHPTSRAQTTLHPNLHRVWNLPPSPPLARSTSHTPPRAPAFRYSVLPLPPPCTRPSRFLMSPLRSHQIFPPPISHLNLTNILLPLLPPSTHTHPSSLGFFRDTRGLCAPAPRSSLRKLPRHQRCFFILFSFWQLKSPF